MPTIKKNVNVPLQPNKRIDNQNRSREFIVATLNRIAQTFRGSQDNYKQSQMQAMTAINKLLNRFFTDRRKVGPLDRIIRYPGLFYLMGYDARTYYQFVRDRTTGRLKRKLPFFDAMPLIFIIQIDRKGFIALNFHWLKPKFRMLVLQRMVVNYPKAFFYDGRIAPMNWKIFANMLGPLRQVMVKGAVRRYSWDRLRRIKGIKINRIPFNDILDIINFTTPMWVGISEAKVHALWNTKRL